MADALWVVSSSRLCVVPGGVLVNNNITICLGGGTTQLALLLRAHHLGTMHPVAGLAQVSLFPAPSATHPGAALGGLDVRVTNQPTGCWVRYSSTVRELPRGQLCPAPWAAQGSVSVAMVSRLCSVTMVTLVACTPLTLVAIQPVISVGCRRPNVVALGHLVRLSRYTRCQNPPLCLPVPVCLMCDVSTCVADLMCRSSCSAERQISSSVSGEEDEGGPLNV